MMRKVTDASNYVNYSMYYSIDFYQRIFLETIIFYLLPAQAQLQ